MTERPILFSAPMIRALLDGRKTMTRRVVKGISDAAARAIEGWRTDNHGTWYGYSGAGRSGGLGIPESDFLRCRYGAAGDRLWVREAWQAQSAGIDGARIFYRATCPGDEADVVGRWRPSIYMPRWASRITLEVTGVRVERVQEITEADAVAEGVDAVPVADVPRQATWTRRQDYAQLWDAINGKRPGCAWADNPWVWSLRFQRVQP